MKFQVEITQTDLYVIDIDDAANAMEAKMKAYKLFEEKKDDYHCDAGSLTEVNEVN